MKNVSKNLNSNRYEQKLMPNNTLRPGLFSSQLACRKTNKPWWAVGKHFDSFKYSFVKAKVWPLNL